MNPFITFLLSLLYTSVIVLLIVSQWIIFQKAGKRGWYSLIPVFGTLVLLQIIEKPWWWILLLLIPFANIVFCIWIMNLLSKSFGKSEGFTVGLILLSFVFFPIMAFGDAKYVGAAGAKGFDPTNPPEITRIEYELESWVITIALLLVINGIFWFLTTWFGFYGRGMNVLVSLLFGSIPLISAGLIKNKSWRITLILLGTIFLAIQFSQIWTNLSQYF